jgi:hypothetical protein
VTVSLRLPLFGNPLEHLSVEPVLAYDDLCSDTNLFSAHEET